MFSGSYTRINKNKSLESSYFSQPSHDTDDDTLDFSHDPGKSESKWRRKRHQPLNKDQHIDYQSSDLQNIIDSIVPYEYETALSSQGSDTAVSDETLPIQLENVSYQILTHNSSTTKFKRPSAKLMDDHGGINDEGFLSLVYNIPAEHERMDADATLREKDDTLLNLENLLESLSSEDNSSRNANRNGEQMLNSLQQLNDLTQDSSDEDVVLVANHIEDLAQLLGITTTDTPLTTMPKHEDTTTTPMSELSTPTYGITTTTERETTPMVSTTPVVDLDAAFLSDLRNVSGEVAAVVAADTDMDVALAKEVGDIAIDLMNDDDETQLREDLSEIGMMMEIINDTTSITMTTTSRTTIEMSTTTEVSAYSQSITDVVTEYEEPVATWSQWSGWTECSATCNLGERTRQRVCELLMEDFIITSNACLGEVVQVMECQERICHVHGKRF